MARCTIGDRRNARIVAPAALGRPSVVTGPVHPWFDGELFVPRYRELARGEWALRIMPLGFATGYWSESVLTANMAALVRRGESWMTITPFAASVP